MRNIQMSDKKSDSETNDDNNQETNPALEVEINNDANDDHKETRNNIDSDDNDKNNDKSETTIADIIGEFGSYQLLMTILAFIRYVCEAMMTNSGSLIAPEVDFSCKLPQNFNQSSINKPANQTMGTFLKEKCSFDLINGSSYDCLEWTYNTTKHGITLTDSFDLVCDRNSLRSTFQSTVSAGVLAAVIWGSFSDRHGRNLTLRVCFVWSLFWGLISCWAPNFLTYTLARALCTFGDAGLVFSLTTIVVETMGNKFRGTVCIIIYTGWSIGVMIVPWLIEYFRDFRLFMLFTVLCHLFTLPWLLWTVGESIRWSLINGNLLDARGEIWRISFWNANKKVDDVQELLHKLEPKYVALAEKKKSCEYIIENNSYGSRLECCFMSFFGGFSKLGQIFSSKELTIVSLAVAWVTFNGELLYMVTTQLNSDIGDSPKLNYAIGGPMEILASLVAIMMISSLTRKLSLTITLLSISSFCFILALTHQMPSISVWVFTLAKFSVSTLTSIAYVIVTELYPTNLRQTGIGITCLLGGTGAILGPYVSEELKNSIGLTWVFYILSIIPLTATLIAILFVRETKGVELSDDIVEIEGDENLAANDTRH